MEHTTEVNTMESVLESALALPVKERYEMLLQLVESFREPLGAGKKGKKSKKSKKSVEASDSEAEPKEPKAPNKWQIGLANVRVLCEANSVNKKLAMDYGKLLKEHSSWPNPSQKEFDQAKVLVDAKKTE
jgi:hypothetical protein